MSHEATACNVTSDIIEVSALLRTILDFCNTLSNKIRRLTFSWYSYCIFPVIWIDPSIIDFQQKLCTGSKYHKHCFLSKPSQVLKKGDPLNCYLRRLSLAVTPYFVTYEDPYKFCSLMIAFPFTINVWRQKKLFEQLFEWTATLTNFLQCSLLKPSPPPWKHQKTKGFLMFSGGSKGNMGQERVNPNKKIVHI